MSTGDEATAVLSGEEIRVLHVEDGPGFAETVELLVERDHEDITVVGETGGEAGLARVEREDVDCVVSAHDMEGMDGLEFLERLREGHPDLPFILFTSDGGEELARDALRAGATDYLRRDGSEDTLAMLANRIRDAVEKRRTQERLTEVRDRYQGLVETAPVPVLVARVNQGVLYANPAALDLFDADDRQSILGHHLEDLFAEDDRDLIRKQIGSVPGEGRTDPVEVRVTDCSGTDHYLLCAMARTTYEGDPTIQVVGQDITGRRDREQKLRRLHESARELMDAQTTSQVARMGTTAAKEILGIVASGVFLVDDDGEALVPSAVTEESREMFGEVRPLPVDGSIAGTVFESGDPVMCDDVHERAEVANPETPVRSELILPLGEYGVLLAGSTEVADFDPTDESLAKVLAANVERALASTRREAELRAERRRVERKNERLEEFAEIVSHDLRNPLQHAQGYVDTAITDPREEYLREASSALDRMEDIVDDVLTLARQGGEVDEEETGPFDLGAIAQQCWGVVPTEDATLEVEDTRTVIASEGRLRQLLENLFRNAIEHGDEDATVRVGTLPDGFYAEDDGPGIPESEREEVFQSGYTTTDEGTGFGLTIVEEVAQAHGWSVDLAGSEEGGVRFEFTGVDGE